MTMDYSPWSEGEIWPFLSVAVSPQPENPRSPKLVCMHPENDINLYLHEFLEPIPINYIF